MNIFRSALSPLIILAGGAYLAAQSALPVWLRIAVGTGTALVVAFSVWMLHWLETERAVQKVVANQHRPAGAGMVESLIADATRLGQRDFVLSELSAIRAAHGHDGVRIGHIAWIYLKLNGKEPRDAVAPSFADDER